MKAILHRTLISIFLLGIISTGVIAQNPDEISKFGADSVLCVRNQSLYAGYYDQKNFDMAVTFWRQNFNECPASSDNIYVRGQVMYQAFYDKTKDRAYVDTLIMILDQRSDYFGNKTANDFRKAGFLHQYSANHPELIAQSYRVLEPYLQESPESLDNNAIIIQMINSVKLYSMKEITQEEVINDYSAIIDATDKLLEAKPGNITLEGAKEMVESLFRQSGVATCDNLIPLFTPQVNEKPEDIPLLKKVIGLLEDAGCEGSNLFYVSAENLYKFEKSANAAHALATINIENERFDEAEKYYLEAIEMETDPLFKSSYLTKLSTLELTNKKDNVKARDYAKQAIELNPNNGTAYLLVGSAYAGTRLNDDEFQNKTVYWAAVDYFIKAKDIDSSLVEMANDNIAKCSANFPKKDEAFFVGIYDEGTPYTVGGWINERTTVRFRK